MAIQNVTGALDPKAANTARGIQPRDAASRSDRFEPPPATAGTGFQELQPEQISQSQQQNVVGGTAAEAIPPSAFLSERGGTSVGDTGQTPATGALEEISADLSSEGIAIREPAFEPAQTITAPRENFETQAVERTSVPGTDAGIQRTERAQVQQQTEVNALSAQRTNSAPSAGLNVTASTAPAAIGSQIDTLV